MKNKNSLSLLILFTLTLSAVSQPAYADGDRADSAESSNYDKSGNYLPGEEVVTPTGKKMKVWSTKGPVPTARAPEPFEDREKSVLDNENVIVDTEALQRDRNRDRRPRDSFDIRPEQPMPGR